ncbi:TPA: tetratricopeptide repeat protein [Candidatus Poribacteria bacterium]|nr:tetratricopeptide repeat protein [Candidatus Poribacteria bacterium]
MKMYFIIRFIRRVFHIIFCSMVLLITLPLGIIASIAVKLSSPGPVFYKGERVGKDGKIFMMYKFRTMYVGTEKKVGGRIIQKGGEGYITKVGKILRMFKVDELPQLLNILKGDMSLVGPRPIRPALLEEYLKDYPDYTKRFAVKPGITGLAQIRGGYFIHPRNKLRYDILYIKNQSFLLDLKLIIKTVYLVIQKVALHYWHKLPLKIIQLRNGRRRNHKTIVLRFHNLPSDDVLRDILFKGARLTVKNLKRELKENSHYSLLNRDLGLAYLMLGQEALAQFYFHNAGETKEATNPVRAQEEILIIADNPYRLQKKILPFLEQRISTNSRTPEFYNNIGIIHLANSEYQRAIISFEQALALLPNSVDALIGLGDSYFQLGQFDLAVEKYESAFGQNEIDASLHFKLGLTLSKSGAYAEAIEHLKQSLSIEPDFPQAQALLKSCKHQLGWDTE